MIASKLLVPSCASSRGEDAAREAKQGGGEGEWGANTRKMHGIISGKMPTSLLHWLRPVSDVLKQNERFKLEITMKFGNVWRFKRIQIYF